MASPQTKNGYTMIANELLAAILFAGFTGTELAIILFIIRQTYGYKKTQDYISISQFVNNTSFKRRGIEDCLKVLQTKKVIILLQKGNIGGQSNLWSLNKDYTQWVAHSSALAQYSALAHQSTKPSALERSNLAHQDVDTKEINKLKKDKIFKNNPSPVSKATLEKLKEDLKAKHIIR